MTKPIVSVFNAAIRSGLTKRENVWQKFYNNLSKSSVPFEVVFAGPVRHHEELPENFHYVYTDAKPAQAAHIAYKRTCGEYLINLPDDAILSVGYLDAMLKKCKEHNNKAIVTGQFKNKIAPSKRGLILPVGGFMSRKVWDKIGGIDNRFFAIAWDLDIALRYYEMGGRVVICDDAIMRENKHKLSRDKKCIEDSDLLNNLWSPSLIRNQRGQLIVRSKLRRTSQVEIYTI